MVVVLEAIGCSAESLTVSLDESLVPSKQIISNAEIRLCDEGDKLSPKSSSDSSQILILLRGKARLVATTSKASQEYCNAVLETRYHTFARLCTMQMCFISLLLTGVCFILFFWVIGSCYWSTY